MVIAAVVLLAAIVALLAVLLALTLRRPGQPKPLAGRTVVVNTRRPDDQAVRGVLVAEHADRVTLAGAVYLDGAHGRPVDGLVHIPVATIAFIQQIEATA